MRLTPSLTYLTASGEAFSGMMSGYGVAVGDGGTAVLVAVVVVPDAPEVVEAALVVEVPDWLLVVATVVV